jgi:hypothetical protein
MVFILLHSIAFSSCIKDRTFTISQVPSPIGPGGKNNILPGTLLVNEILATGSTNYNELILPGNPNGGSDWIEVFNTTNDTILLEAGKWFVSDSLSNPTKYKLPQSTILPRGFLVIWADGMDTVISQIHTNFSLSKNGEESVLYYKKSSSNEYVVDQQTFGAQQSAKSFARLPDGSTYWDFSTNPTPGQPNKQ